MLNKVPNSKESSSPPKTPPLARNLALVAIVLSVAALLGAGKVYKDAHAALAKATAAEAAATSTLAKATAAEAAATSTLAKATAAEAATNLIENKANQAWVAANTAKATADATSVTATLAKTTADAASTIATAARTTADTALTIAKAVNSVPSAVTKLSVLAMNKELSELETKISAECKPGSCDYKTFYGALRKIKGGIMSSSRALYGKTFMCKKTSVISLYSVEFPAPQPEIDTVQREWLEKYCTLGAKIGLYSGVRLLLELVH